MLEENTITNMENNKEVDEEMENIVKDANVYKSKL